MFSFELHCSLSDSSDCILVGSSVWVKAENSNDNEKRTVYRKRLVKRIQNKKVLVSSIRGYTNDIIPDIILTDSSQKSGLSVIGKDAGKYYGGKLRRRVNKSTWEIQSHGVTWRSHRANIRVIEKPEYCF